MRLCLLTYFDLGMSFGLGDDVFTRASQEGGDSAPNILSVGIRNPLGEGLVFPVAEAVLWKWKEEAKTTVGLPEMELGYVPDACADEEEASSDFNRFKQELIERIDRHPIRAEMTVYALGTGLLHLEFEPGIPLKYLQGFYKCYEYAAYEVKMSEALERAAWQKVEPSLVAGGEGLRKLAERPRPAIEVDPDRVESRLFTSFTRLAICIDPGDHDEAAAITRALLPPEDGEGEDAEVEEIITYEYHGDLHFNWAGCVLIPRTENLSPKEARREIERMLTGINIAHAFLGTCEAFEKLFLYQTLQQADSFLRNTPHRLNSRDLNRLRTLALAVISLTNFTSVAATAEDQKFFKRFERHAHIRSRHKIIQTRCEILYNVQQEETQTEEAQQKAQEEKRQNRLNGVISTLTVFTLISILSDSYNFILENEKHLVWPMMNRIILVSVLFIAILMVLLLLLHFFHRKEALKRTEQMLEVPQQRAGSSDSEEMAIRIATDGPMT